MKLSQTVWKVVNWRYRHSDNPINVTFNISYFAISVPIEDKNLSGTHFYFGAYHPKMVSDTERISKP
jgi:hypothetical protein